ncbi:Methyltransferase-like protein 2 [Morus notabilis]|uniref:Methyltransferase-like protein 2 n=1 Tax=Morus notabilis TaxID=981085 RepID=W9S117_9ROSA|nr:Methyltransferase-like protein 2 [Morus notabilis]
MEVSKLSEKLFAFLESGIYRFENSNSIFIDPVRVLNQSYTRFRVSPSAYYSRFFESSNATQQSSNSRKRKRKEKEKKPYALNERERAADRRHQESEPLLLKALESLQRATDLLEVICNLRDLSDSSPSSSSSRVQQSLIELGRVWQAPLYEITLKFHPSGERNEGGGSPPTQYCERVLPVFNNLIVNETSDDLEAEFMNTRYILPHDSSFYMPYRYPTLPNKYFLSVPIKKLSHKEGAIIALWVTNREKLRCFVEEELFPAWGVKYMATFYWLKAVDSNSMSRIKAAPDNQVIISIPGDYSRKPPIGGLLKEYIAGHSPSRCLELFAREMLPQWVSWGNEPLQFQESRYFYERKEG